MAQCGNVSNKKTHKTILRKEPSKKHISVYELTRRTIQEHANQILDKCPPPTRQPKSVIKQEYLNFLKTITHASKTLYNSNAERKKKRIANNEITLYGNIELCPMLTRNEIISLIMTLSEKFEDFRQLDINCENGKEMPLVDMLSAFYTNLQNGQISSKLKLLRISNHNLTMYNIDGMNYLEL